MGYATLLRLAISLLMVFCIGACVSKADTRFYTLDMAPSGIAKSEVFLNVVRVETLEPLSHPEILIQTSPTQVEYYAKEAWSASLQELVGEKMTAELGGKMAGQKSFDLLLKVQAFQQVDLSTGPEACVKLIAEIREEGASLYDPPIFQRTYESHIPATLPAPNGIVLALSDCLEQIAGKLTMDVKQLQTP